MNRLRYIILCLLIAVTVLPAAADTTPKTYSEVGKQLYEQTNYYTADGKNIIKFNNHIALVGPNCLVNRLFTTVKVGSMNHDLDNLTDSVLSNEASFPSVVQLNLGYTPIVSVRDMKHHYAPYTPAGFCIDASSDKSILKLDVGKTYIIRFYREGQFVESQAVTAGKHIEGVNLSLIQLPGSKNVCFNVEATPTQEYDEVELCTAEGVNLSVATSTKIKYAYVGTANMYTITNNPKTALKDGTELPNLEDYCKDMGRKPTVATTGIGLFSSKVVDGDLTNFYLNPPISIVWGGGVQVLAAPETGDPDQTELFKPGSMVGFKIKAAGLLNLQLGSVAKIQLLNQNKQVVQTETMDAQVLGLEVGTDKDRTFTVEADSAFSGVKITFWGGVGVNLGGTGIYYAFVTPAPDKAGHHCPIDLSASTSLCDYNQSLQLSHNPDINIKSYEVVSATATDGKTDVSQECTVSPSGLVTFAHTDNSQYDGIYVIKATAEDGCYELDTITRGIPANSYAASTCENKIENISGQTAEYALADNSHGGGSLLSISKLSDANNIFDGRTDTYASWTGGVKILQNVEIVGVKRTDKTSFRSLLKDDPKDSIRVGFVVETQSVGLNLSLLDGFQIKCYNSQGSDPDKAVASALVSDTKVLGLSLIGSNKVQKVELAATIPAGVDFDEFTLWSTGVLNLSVEKMNIYYPFYEDGSDYNKCNNQLYGSTQVSNSATGATISAGGNNVSVANIGGFMENLGNAVDDDPNYQTAVTWGNGVQAGAFYSLGIKLGRTYDFRHQLAVVMNKDVNHYLSVNAGNFLKIETYYKGKPTGDAKNSWQVLGADVLTTQDRDLYLMSPKQQYDEIVITMGAVANVAGVQKLYGIALLPDADGDGVADSRDDNSCEAPKISDVVMTSVCQGEKTSQISWTGTEASANYQVVVPGQKVVKNSDGTITLGDYVYTVQHNTDGSLNYTLPLDSSLNMVGRNKIAFINDESGNQLGYAVYSVYPQTTEWKADAASTDWNDWDNWTNGAPTVCSNVIIPTNAKRYPVLEDVSTDAEKDYENACNGIHFQADAAVENIYRLTYDSAWVDLALVPGVTRLYMSPLASVKSGDFFADKVSVADYFKPLTDANDPADRLKNPITQRVWESTTGYQYKLQSDNSLDNETINIESTGWSNAFNDLNQDYSSFSSSKAPYSFALMTEPGAQDTCYIHLPKSGTRTYYYYDDQGNKVGEAQTVEHSSAKLWSTDNWTDGDELSIKYANNSSATADGIFLVGNPMMSHLNVKRFLKTNEANNKIEGVKCYNGNNAYSVILVNGSLVSSDDLTQKNLYVGPANAFFVQEVQPTDIFGKNKSYDKAITVTYSHDMYGDQPASADELYKAPALEPSFLRINAQAGNYHVGTVVLNGSDAQAPTLVDKDYMPHFSIFTEKDGKAYDIRPADENEINLGFFSDKADSVRLSFQTSGSFDASAWKLCDRVTGAEYSLDEMPTIYISGSSVGRYYLARIASGISSSSDNASGLVLSMASGVATVKSSASDLLQLSVYDEAGSMLGRAQASGAESLSVPVARGVVVLHATCSDGREKTWKVIAE